MSESIVEMSVRLLATDVGRVRVETYNVSVPGLTKSWSNMGTYATVAEACTEFGDELRVQAERAVHEAS